MKSASIIYILAFTAMTACNCRAEESTTAEPLFSSVKELGESCDEDEQCRTHSHCESSSNSNTCQCDRDFYQSSGNCYLRRPLLDFCSNTSSTNQCVENALCVSNRTTSLSHCQCRPEFYMFNNSTCIPGIPPLGFCSQTSLVNQCSHGASCVYNATSSTSICECDTHFYMFNNRCFSERMPEDECGLLDQCIENAKCVNDSSGISKCKCDESFVFFSDKCVAISYFMPRNLTASKVRADDMTIRWIAPNVTPYQLSFKIETSPHADVQQTNPRSMRKCRLSNLTPGTLYNISVKTVINLAHTKKESPPAFILQHARPDKPRITKKDNSVPMKLKFEWTVRGIVDSFYGYLCKYIKSHPTDCKNFTTEKNSIVFENLHVNTTYLCNITARVGSIDGKTSFVNKSTKISAASSVSDLQMVDIEATSFAVMFSHHAMLTENVVGFEVAFNNTYMNSSSQCVILQRSGTVCRKLPDWGNCQQTSNFSVINSSVLYFGFTDAAPDCDYSVTVWTWTCYQSSLRSTPTYVHGRTLNAVPNIVTSIAVTDTVSVLNESPAVSVNITWLAPQPRPGSTNYTVTVWDAVSNSSTYNGCSSHGYENTSCSIGHLLSFWEYYFEIFAETSAGKSSSVVSDLVVTSEWNPGLPKLVNISKNANSYRLCHLTLEDPVPEKRNTLITGYKIIIVCNSSMQIYTESSFSQIENLTDADYRRTKSSTYEFEFAVIPGSYYKLWIYALCQHNSTSEPKIAEYQAPVGRPPVWMGGPVAGPAVETTRTSFMLEFNNAAFFHNNSNGKIWLRGLIISDYEWISSSIYGGSFNIPSWHDAQKNLSENLPYFYRISLDELEAQQHGKLRIEIGRDADCASPARKYCNGNLQSGTSYFVRGFVCTVAGCTISPSAGPYETRDDVVASGGVGGGVYAGISITIILIIIILVFGGIWIQKRTRVVNKGATRLSLVHVNLPRCSRNRPVKLCELKTKVAEMHKDSGLHFSVEYGDVNSLSPSHPTNASQQDENKQKNRFINVIPFDHSRVLLTQIDDDDLCSDYINASYIDGYNRENEYIAAQGPLPATVDDFWRMIWEQNIAIVVMVTPVKEAGQIKCEQYWPQDVFDPRQYGEVIVENTSASTVNTYNLSVFSVKHTQNPDEVHKVYHFHFLNWRDMTADLEAHNLLDFVKTVRSYVRGDMKGPILVHCSAGVGRTGTFITIDYLTQFISEHNLDDEVDIFGFILKMRDRRLIMVQAEAQYTFIHDAAVELIEEKQNAQELADSEDNSENCTDSMYMNVEALSASPNCKYMNVDGPSSPTNTCINTGDFPSSEEDDTLVTDSCMSSSTTKLLTTEL